MHTAVDARQWTRAHLWEPLSACRGQGTVEYVGIVILVGALLIALKTGIGDKQGASTLAHKISASVSDAIQHVMDDKAKTGG